MFTKGLPVCILVASALATSGNVFAKPDTISPDAARNCRFLGGVEGSSGYGKTFRWEPLAKGSAERKATALGATHIEYVTYRQTGSFNGSVSARAYACP